MKKIVGLILLVVAIVACMALPVAAAGFTIPKSSMKTQYYGSSLCDKGVSTFKTEGRVKCIMTISNGKNGTRRGEKTYYYNSTAYLNHTATTVWVDHSYKCNYVHCTLAV